MNQERRIFLLFTVLSIAEGSLYITDFQMNRMIELTIRKPHCRVHTDRGTIQHVVLNMDQMKVRQVPIETIHTMEKVCFEGNQLTSEIQGGLSFIYPGTLWCGPGTLAKNYSDLGRHNEEDKCCRAHDNCYPQIAPGDCLKSICNKGQFTRLHCSCDDQFRRCLSSLNTDVSNILGAMFFNTVQVTCFEVRRPCSDLQRQQCDYAFYKQDNFAFRHEEQDPLENLVVAEARVGVQPANYQTQRRFFDPYSMQLIFHAIVGFNESEIAEICSRYKFRPSSKYQQRPTTGNLQNGLKLKRPQLI